MPGIVICTPCHACTPAMKVAFPKCYVLDNTESSKYSSRLCVTFSLTSLQSGDNSLTLEEDVDFGGRDQVPQRLVSL
jgi:hypothetical protein